VDLRDFAYTLLDNWGRLNLIARKSERITLTFSRRTPKAEVEHIRTAGTKQPFACCDKLNPWLFS
jgi:hypothetical protein